MPDVTWLLLAYRMPPEPAARRVSVWRKIKGTGAVYLQGGVCLVPMGEDALRRLKIIENDILAAGGDCVILQTVALDAGQEARVVARFKADRDAAYDEFLDKCGDFEREVLKEVEARHFTFAELEENDADLRKLRDWLAQIRALDFYPSGRADEAEARLAACTALLDDYARQVYDATGEAS